MILAGEESGVIYAKRISAAVRQIAPDAEIRGYGDYGFKTADLGVFGYWEVIKRIFYFLRVKRTMERAIDEWRPDVVCTIDYPGMNLKLAGYAHRHGVRAVHVVCPQVWAWHQDRIPKIEASLDHLCCFLPFEPKIFRPGLAEFVGHPLVEEFSDAAIREWRGERPVERQLAILPGSRIGEVMHHLPTLLEVVRKLGVKAVIPAANDKVYRVAATMLEKANLPQVELVRGKAREVLARSTAAVVASGTATMEAALLQVPTVVIYKVSYLLGKFLHWAIKGTKYVGLANVIWDRCGGVGEQPMPEFLQEDFTVENVLRALRPQLEDASVNAATRTHLAETTALLKGDGDAITRIAKTLCE